MIIVRPARVEEAGELTLLVLRSKAHWGYDQDFLARCRPVLTVQPGDVAGKRIMVAQDGGLLGFAGVGGRAPEGELTDLWVEPAAIGRGVGRLLFRHAAAVAGRAGMLSITIEAEPYAVGFYRAMGAELIGETPSTLFPDRMLPVLRYRLEQDAGRRGER